MPPVGHTLMTRGQQDPVPKENKMGEVKLYNLHDGLTGRDGGPYLDQEERRLAEIVRARVEKREPDFDNMPATAGTPLVTGAQLVALANPASNPSQLSADPVSVAVEAAAVNEDFPVTAHSVREQTDAEVKAEEDAKNPYNPASPAVIGQDEDNTSPEPKATPKRTTKKAAAKKAAAPKAEVSTPATSK